MRKNASFAVAALVLGWAMILFATTSLVATSVATRARHVVAVDPFLPAKTMEPAW